MSGGRVGLPGKLQIAARIARPRGAANVVFGNADRIRRIALRPDREGISPCEIGIYDSEITDIATRAKYQTAYLSAKSKRDAPSRPASHVQPYEWRKNSRDWQDSGQGDLGEWAGKLSGLGGADGSTPSEFL